MINTDIKNLFKQYCYDHNILSEDATELEKTIRAFTESLTHDLTRALYLNKLTDHPVAFPDPIKEIQLLLKQFVVADPYLKSLRDRPFALGDDLQELLEVERQCYSLVRDPIIQELLKNPTEEGLRQVIHRFDLAEWKQRIEHVQSLTHFDHIYDEDLQKFLQCMEEGQNPNQTLEEHQKLLNAILPIVYRLVRRGEVGLELVDLVLEGRFSYLCFVQIIATKGNKFDEALKTGMMISRLDMLHEFQFLSTKLFLVLRKQGIRNIKKELQNRMSLVQLLMELHQQKWIASKQIESILKTSRSQQVAPLLATLEKFKIKKEVGLIRNKIKGAEQEIKMVNQLSELSTSLPILTSFWKELLKGKSWEEREDELSVKEIGNLLKKYTKQLPTRPSIPVPRPKQNQQPSDQSQRISVQQANTRTAAAKQESPSVQPIPFAEKMQSLQQQLTQASQIQKEITDGADTDQDSLTLLGERLLLLPETVHLFQQKLKMLQQKWEQKALRAQDHPEKLLDKWEEEIQQGMKIDTHAFKLLETLKTYEANWQLTTEEQSKIKNMNQPFHQRSLWVDKCFQKYALLEELRTQTTDATRLNNLHYETESPLLLYVLQDILKQNSFYFEGKTLSVLTKVCPSTGAKQLESSRQLVNRLFEKSLRPGLLINLVCWGVLLIEPEQQNEIEKTLAQTQEHSQTTKWNHLKSSSISLDLIQRILQSIPEPVLASIDQEGKEIVSNCKEILTQSDETSIENISEEQIEYLLNSLMVTEYILHIRRLVECFQKIENAVNDPTLLNTENLPSPSNIAERFFHILELEDYEQRLELLIEQVISIFSEDDPLVQHGKKLYQDVIGFEF